MGFVRSWPFALFFCGYACEFRLWPTIASLLALLGPAVSWAFFLVYVFSPVITYLPQYLLIINGSGSSFSTLVCLVLLVSNITRVFFWLGEPFDDTLLYQALVMVAVQLVMLEACIRTRPKRMGSERVIWDKRWPDFWQWDTFESYVVCIVGLVVVVGLMSLLWLSEAWFVSLMGALSLSTEATLGLPQVYQNRKGTAGLSHALIWSWLIGDLGKTCYFLYLNAPLQFTLCGLFQIAVDGIIFYQISHDSTSNFKPSPSSSSLSLNSIRSLSRSHPSSPSLSSINIASFSSSVSDSLSSLSSFSSSVTHSLSSLSSSAASLLRHTLAPSTKSGLLPLSRSPSHSFDPILQDQLESFGHSVSGSGEENIHI